MADTGKARPVWFGLDFGFRGELVGEHASWELGPLGEPRRIEVRMTLDRDIPIEMHKELVEHLNQETTAFLEQAGYVQPDEDEEESPERLPWKES